MNTQIHRAMSKVAQTIALMNRTFEFDHLTDEAKVERLQTDFQDVKDAYESLEHILGKHFEDSESFEVDVPGH